MFRMTLKQRLKDIAGSRFYFLTTAQRYGRQQIENYRWLLASQHWSADELREFQWNRITVLLKHAYQNTEFYRERFDALGAEPEDFKSTDDLRKLPCLTKEDVRLNLSKLQSRNLAQQRPFQIRTGGSSGAPARLFKSRDAEYMRKAIAWRSIAWGGVDFRETHIAIDNTFTFDGIDYPWWVDHRSSAILVKTFRVDDELFSRYLELHRHYQPTYYWGSIGFFRVLSHYMEEHKIQDIRPKALFLIGETITPDDRKKVRECFGCDLYDFYGLRENAASAAECGHHNLHINSEFTYIEFEREGRPAAAGESAEIIGTNLFNYATPVIRYRTEDIGSRLDSQCPCGRAHPQMRIEGGRTRDYLTIRSGKVFVTWHIIHLIDDKIGVKALQLYQPDIANVIVRIVRRDSFSEEDERRILETLCKITRGELQFRVEFVEAIPRTELGKYIFVKSNLPKTG